MNITLSHEQPLNLQQKNRDTHAINVIHLVQNIPGKTKYYQTKLTLLMILLAFICALIVHISSILFPEPVFSICGEKRQGNCTEAILCSIQVDQREQKPGIFISFTQQFELFCERGIIRQPLEILLCAMQCIGLFTLTAIADQLGRLLTIKYAWIGATITAFSAVLFSAGSTVTYGENLFYITIIGLLGLNYVVGGAMTTIAIVHLYEHSENQSEKLRQKRVIVLLLACSMAALCLYNILQLINSWFNLFAISILPFMIIFTQVTRLLHESVEFLWSKNKSESLQIVLNAIAHENSTSIALGLDYTNNTVAQNRSIQKEHTYSLVFINNTFSWPQLNFCLFSIILALLQQVQQKMLYNTAIPRDSDAQKDILKTQLFFSIGDAIGILLALIAIQNLTDIKKSMFTALILACSLTLLAQMLECAENCGDQINSKHLPTFLLALECGTAATAFAFAFAVVELLQNFPVNVRALSLGLFFIPNVVIQKFFPYLAQILQGWGLNTSITIALFCALFGSMAIKNLPTLYCQEESFQASLQLETEEINFQHPPIELELQTVQRQTITNQKQTSEFVRPEGLDSDSRTKFQDISDKKDNITQKQTKDSQQQGYIHQIDENSADELQESNKNQFYGNQSGYAAQVDELGSETLQNIEMNVQQNVQQEDDL